jgi:hypothetical protein
VVNGFGRSVTQAARGAAMVATVTAVAGCAPGPIGHPTAAPGGMNRPVPLGKDSASGALETERRQLEGTWDLARLELAPTPDAARVPVQASGTLIYDEYGNLTIDAHTSDPAAPVAAREATLLSFKGRAVLDVVKHELKLMDLTGNVNPDEVLSPERRRRYEINQGTMTLSSFDDSGRVTAVTTWRRRP